MAKFQNRKNLGGKRRDRQGRETSEPLYKKYAVRCYWRELWGVSLREQKLGEFRKGGGGESRSLWRIKEEANADRRGQTKKSRYEPESTY